MSDQTQAVEASYDAVAATYAEQLGDELDGKPLDRALLAAVCELGADGVLADLGCGPGHVTRFLAQRHPSVLGLDLSPEMIAIARAGAPDLTFRVGSMLDLPLPDAALAAAVALYSVIHFTADERRLAFREIRRVLRPGGHLLVSAHVDGPDVAAGDVHRTDELLGHRVQLDHYFVAGDVLAAELTGAGFDVVARLDRAPVAGAEYPSNRTYVLARSAQFGDDQPQADIE